MYLFVLVTKRKKEQYMSDVVKPVILRINLPFTLIELGIHMNNVFCSIKERNICSRKKTIY